MKEKDNINNNKGWLLLAVAAFFIAFFLCTFNTSDNFFELLSKSSYYRDLAINTFVAFVVITLCQFITIQLNQKFLWESSPSYRLFWQLLLGITLPALAAYLLAFLQFRFLIPDHVFGNPSFLKVEFPVILLFIFLTNLFFVLLYFYKKWQAGEQIIHELKLATANQNVLKELIGEKGRKKVAISVDQIGLISLDKGITKITLTQGETYLFSQSLNTVMETLDVRLFFSANRQNIVHRQICQSYKSIDFGKIELSLSPPFNPLIISQKSAATFRKWIKA